MYTKVRTIMRLLWVVLLFSPLANLVVGSPRLFVDQENYENLFEQKPQDPYSRSVLDDRETSLFEDDARVKDFVNTVRTCKNVPGLSIAVVKRGQVWTAGFGVKDLKTKAPVDTNTLFGIGSLTKGFTAALLAIALEEANLKGMQVSWQTRLKDLLGEDFVLIDHLEENVTLDDVLTHRTGLYAVDIMAVADFPSRFSRTDFLRRLRFLPKTASLRRRMIYNNWMYALAGDASERLLGGRWETLMKERLLSPLGMDQTQIVWEDINVTSSKMAHPYQAIRGYLQEVDKNLFELSQGRPSGALATSADDMAKWMRFLLEGTEFLSGDSPVSENKMNDMMTAHVPVNMVFRDTPLDVSFTGYGYGWFTGTYRGKKTVSHTGGWFGYKCYLTLYPDDDVAVYVATNGPGTSAATRAYRVISYYLSDLALGFSPWLDPNTACTFGGAAAVSTDSEKDNQLGDVLETALNDSQKYMYIGKYSHSLYGDLIIQKSSSYYGLVFRFQNIEGFLKPDGEFRFNARSTGKTEFYTVEDFKTNWILLRFRQSFTPEGKCQSLIMMGPNAFNFERMQFKRND